VITFKFGEAGGRRDGAIIWQAISSLLLVRLLQDRRPPVLLWEANTDAQVRFLWWEAMS
jgi:hypothetical protein